MDMDVLIGRIGMQDGWRIIRCMSDMRLISAQQDVAVLEGGMGGGNVMD